MSLTNRGPNATSPARLPALQASRATDPDVRRSIEALREWIEVRLGSRGDYWERAVTFRDLKPLLDDLQAKIAAIDPEAATVEEDTGLQSQLRSLTLQFASLNRALTLTAEQLRTQITTVNDRIRETSVDDVFVMAVDMRPTAVNGCNAITTVDFGATKPNFHALMFPHTADTSCDFHTMLPASWAGKQFKVRIYWGHDVGATAFGVAWEVVANTTFDNETVILDFVPGTVVTDAGGVGGNLYIAESEPVPMVSEGNEEGSLVSLRVYRRTGNAADTLDIHAALLAARFTLVDDVLRDDVEELTCDPYWTQVSLLLDGDGTDGATSFTDDSTFARTVSNFGTAQFDTAFKPFGGASIYLPNSSAYLTVPNGSHFAFTGDFTVEAMVRFSTVSTFQNVAIQGDNGGAWWLRVTNAGQLGYGVIGGSDLAVTASGLLAANTWHHVAMTRAGTTFRMFVDGVLRHTSTRSGTIGVTAPSSPLYVGGGSYPINNGHVRSLRITNACRYAADFDAPTAPFPTTQCAVTGPTFYEGLTPTPDTAAHASFPSLTYPTPSGPALTARNDFVANIQAPFSAQTWDDDGWLNGDFISSFSINGNSVTALSESGGPGGVEIRAAISSGGVVNSSLPGRWNTTPGGRFIVDLQTNGSGAYLQFASPIAAFGCYITDAGDFSAEWSLVLVPTSGPEIVRPLTLSISNQALVFVGFVDRSGSTYSGVKIIGTSVSDIDGVGIDDLIAATPAQLT